MKARFRREKSRFDDRPRCRTLPGAMASHRAHGGVVARQECGRWEDLTGVMARPSGAIAVRRRPPIIFLAPIGVGAVVCLDRARPSVLRRSMAPLLGASSAVARRMRCRAGGDGCGAVGPADLRQGDTIWSRRSGRAAPGRAGRTITTTSGARRATGSPPARGGRRRGGGPEPGGGGRPRAGGRGLPRARPAAAGDPGPEDAGGGAGAGRAAPGA